MNRTILIPIFLSLVMLVPARAGERVDTAKLVARLKAVKIELGSQDDPKDLKGIATVAEMLKEKRLIGLGEFSHGSLQAQVVRVKLVKELVVDHGFRFLFLEEPLARTRRIDAYICEVKNAGTAKDAMLAGNWSWIWSTDEMAKLFDWMRDFNLGRPVSDMVHLIGVDNQYMDEQIFELKRLLSETICSEELKAAVDQAYDQIPKIGLAYGNAQATAEVYRDPERPTKRILAHALMAKAKAISITEKGLNPAVLGLLQSAFLGTMLAVTQDYNVRELAMVDAIKTSLEATRGSKGMFWAHNLHVSSGYVSDGYSGVRLKEWLGAQYYALGVFAAHGEIHAKNVFDHDAYDVAVRLPGGKVPEMIPVKRMYYSMPKWFWEGVLSKAGKSYFADGKSVGRDRKIGDLIHKRRYDFGMAGEDYYQEKGKPPQTEVIVTAPAMAYDGWIFIDQTTPSSLFQKQSR